MAKVLTKPEVDALLAQTGGTVGLFLRLLYGICIRRGDVPPIVGTSGGA